MSLDVPNAGRKLVTLPKRMQWDPEFKKLVKDLDSKKPVIICGDMNVAHQEIGTIFLFWRNMSFNNAFWIRISYRYCKSQIKQTKRWIHSRRKGWFFRTAEIGETY